jgi:hypothetical protein
LDYTKQLIEVLKQSETIFFVGAGCSNSAGLPDWIGLLERLADFCDQLDRDSSEARELIIAKDFEYAASILREFLDDEQHLDFLSSLSDFVDAEPKIIHEKLVSFGIRSFITTNYDCLLEKAVLAYSGDNIEIVTNGNRESLTRICKATSKDFVYKLHGHIEEPGSIVLTRNDYNQLIHDNIQASHCLRTLFSSRPIVFIGYSLSDRDFQFHLDFLHQVTGGNLEDIFAILPDVGLNRIETYYKHNGIKVVPYDSSNNHEKLILLLGELFQETRETVLDEPETRFVVNGNIEDSYSVAEVKSELASVSPDLEELEFRLLSILYWAGPQTEDQITQRIRASGYSDDGVIEQLASLAEREVITKTARLYIPRNEKLMASIAISRLEADALLILEEHNE